MRYVWTSLALSRPHSLLCLMNLLCGISLYSRICIVRALARIVSSIFSHPNKSISIPFHATRFPFLFFFGTSVMVRPRICRSITCIQPISAFPLALHPFLPPSGQFRANAPGGKLCFNLSAFSESFSTRVYRNREHRTLNLIW